MDKVCSSALKLKHRPAMLPTVEIDLDRLPEPYHAYQQILAPMLSSIAVAYPRSTASIYIALLPSVNFFRHSYSAFIGVHGPEKILDALHDRLERIAGLPLRYSDMISSQQARLSFHLEAGKAWQPLEGEDWVRC